MAKNYTRMISKIGNIARRRPEFYPGIAAGEAAQLHKVERWSRDEIQ